MVNASSLVAVWALWVSPLTFSSALLLTCLGVSVANFYSISVRKKLKQELDASPLPYHRFQFRVYRWLFWTFTALQLVLAIARNNVLVWVITGVLISIFGAIYYHDFQELKNMEATLANRPPEPMPGAVH